MSFVARGPLKLVLQSTAGQYAILGAGLYALFPNEVRRFLAPFLTGYPQLSNSFARSSRDNDSNSTQQQQQPIIIQTPAPTVYTGSTSTTTTSKTSKLLDVLTYAIVGAGVCWAGYALLMNVLPDAVAQMLPVTKKYFEKTTQTLGRGILNIKQVLEEKILGLSKQQDALGKKQDETQETVSDIQKELGEARIDLVLLRDALQQCQLSLDDTQHMQGYTLRGIKLLVRCVTSFLPDEGGDFFNEIAKFIQDGEDEDNRRKSNGGAGGGYPRPGSDMNGSSSGGPPIAHAVVTPVHNGGAVSTNGTVATMNGSGVHHGDDVRDIHALLGN